VAAVADNALEENAIKYCKFCQEPLGPNAHKNKLFCDQLCLKKAQYRANPEKFKARVAAHKLVRGQYTAPSVERLRAMRDALKSVPCYDCQVSFDPECMDFDHRDGSQKSFTISKAMFAVQGNTDIILAEVAKCDVVCANCHRLRTKRRRQNG